NSYYQITALSFNDENLEFPKY
ncbi:hypothetical protein ACTFGS_04275, partial [Campylobacter jejuni]